MNPSVNDTNPANRFSSAISFAEKLAFICNLFFLVCVFVRLFASNETITYQGLIIVIGVILSPVINSLLCIIHLYCLFTANRYLLRNWLPWINTVLFIIQIIYLFS